MSNTAHRSHPVADFAAAGGERLRELGGMPLWSMTPAEQRQTLLDLARMRAEIDALYLKMLAEADVSAVTDESGAASAADYVAVATHQTRRSARSDLALARGLRQHPHLETAVGASVLPEQARVIIRAVDRLPDEIEPAEREKAELHLIHLAAHHDATELTRLGNRLVEVIAPEEADRIEGKLLARQEAAAQRRASFTMVDDGEGTTSGRFRIPTHVAAMLHKFLLALTSPTGNSPHARGIAFADLVERIPADFVPMQGGATATVVVTMTEQQLRDGLGATGLDTGDQISVSQARRFACTAGIIPAVLGGRSQVLDLGRRTRFHTRSQRLAMLIRDGGCTAEGCDRPPALCEAHHDDPWSLGGDTSVERGRLLCGHHHRCVHDPQLEVTALPSGKIRFHRRT